MEWTPLIAIGGAPPADDREMGALLATTRRCLGAGAVELTVRTDAADEVAYRSGDSSGGGWAAAVELPSAPGYRARLAADVPELPAAVVELVAVAVEQLLVAKLCIRQGRLLRAAVDGYRDPVLLFDRTGDIAHANPPADELLSRQTEGGPSVVVDGREEPLVAHLCRLVEEIGDGSWSGSLQLGDGSVVRCEANVLCQSGEHRGTAVVLQPRRLGPAAISDVAERYGLSAREREVLELLAKGLRTNELAEALYISPHTVRDHCKQLYRKCGCRSRAELLGLISGSAPRPR